MQNDVPAAAIDDEMGEFRCQVPRWAMVVFDARCKGERRTKQELGSRIVTEWAKAELHAATIVTRCYRGNGDEPQPDWASNG